MRVALYWAPSRSDPLATFGNAWLGRDPEHGGAVAQPEVADIAQATLAPRLYGFHATLGPPMRLATGWEEFMQAALDVAAGVAPFDLPPLLVADMSGFLALREALPCPPLQALADACVAGMDAHRLRPGADQIARRRAAGLSPVEEALLLRWGYPYVMQAWRFHMTLTGRLDAAAMNAMRPAAEAHFADPLALPRRVEEIVVFTQRGDAPFVIAERLRLGAARPGA